MRDECRIGQLVEGADGSDMIRICRFPSKYINKGCSLCRGASSFLFICTYKAGERFRRLRGHIPCSSDIPCNFFHILSNELSWCNPKVLFYKCGKDCTVRCSMGTFLCFLSSFYYQFISLYGVFSTPAWFNLETILLSRGVKKFLKNLV